MKDRPENHEPVAPNRLVEALRSLHNQRPLVPPSVDEAVLGQARAHLKDGAEKATAKVVRFPSWTFAAAAAVVVLGLAVGLLLNQHRSRPPVVAREDVDRNGKVNILDAFALARKLQRGGTAGAQLDLNGDGVVDQGDIDWVAARAVKLHKG